jgi:hypothetical protein
MKSLIAVLLLVPAVSFAKKCPSGTEPYKGECVSSDATPYGADPVKPSEEKVPEEKMPSWQRPDVTVVNAPNMADADAKLDQEKAQADHDGKKAAGLLNKEAGK